MTQDNGYILEMKNISKSFPGVKALDKVNLKVRKGTVHALIGENGAGKSTLMKVLSGAHQIDEGEIYFDGQKLGRQNARSTLELGISMIHQELSTVLDMTIAENIFLGREPESKIRLFVDFKEIYKNTEMLLSKLGIKYNPRMKMRKLSVAGMQMIEITKAISRGAKLIIMDEPTSSITDSEVQILFKQIRELKSKGVSIIYISHKLDEIFEICDDITVIRDGKWIASGSAGQYDKNKLVTQMVGREITEIFPKETVEIGETLLEVKGLTRKGIFEDVSFNVRKGEILGISGLVGAGRTEVVRGIFGLDHLDSGEIILEGKKLKIKSPSDAIKNGIVMLPEDRKLLGLALCRSVKENIVLANLNKMAPGMFINSKKELEEINKLIELLSIKVPSVNTPANNLSGGNQQKVVLAKWLLGQVKVFILDEPTRGIDVGAKSEIHRLMCSLAQKGLCIIMISSELPEILGMSDRILVMHEGRLQGEISRQEATQEKVMTLATGGNL
jgi:inositol transport system ATP-binding protein